ncbi:MAG: hypothetical protein WA666_11350 [Nitrospirota bacterium]
MSQAFVIMQIGNPDLDNVYKDAIFPALQEGCGLSPKRVDKHNEGRLLKSEIVGFIQSSDIIIADLTNERPNCYLEIGYAMGLDKFRNLILTCREDHHHDSPNYKKQGPKVHFDLSGYDILFWNPENLDEFKNVLIKRVKRRLATLITTVSAPPKKKWDDEWISKHQKIASDGLKATGLTGFMEIRMVLPEAILDIPQGELLDAADRAEVHTTGWPIGVVLHNRDEFRPRPTTEGIVAEIASGTYDYWTIRKDGSFYFLRSSSEIKPGYIFFDTRIRRVTEAFLYTVRLYNGLKAPQDSRVLIGIRHGGLEGLILSATEDRSFGLDERKSTEDEVYTEVETRLDKIEPDLVNLVQQITDPLFILFDFRKFDRMVVEDIVNNFVAGRCT